MNETNLYTITVPPAIHALESLIPLLDKAKKHADSKKLSWMDFEEALLHDRIVFDQFPFVRQVQVACDNAKGMAARLAEVEIPKYEDNEKTFAELKERIEKTISFLKSIKVEQIVGKENVSVSLPYWNGKHMNGFEYVTRYVLPNFYFHITTAYTILRKNGIEVGKYDYMTNLPLKD